jgi:hypothetical protein
MMQCLNNCFSSYLYGIPCNHVVRATRSNTEQQTTKWCAKIFVKHFDFFKIEQKHAAIVTNILLSANYLFNEWFVAFVAPVFGGLQFLQNLFFQIIFQKQEQQEQHYFLTIIYAVNKNKNKD